MTDSRLSGPWAAYAAALWSLVFAVFHILWATGWYVGLRDPEGAAEAFAKTPFLVYDVVVAGICVFAVPVALALGMPWGRRLPRRLVGVFAWLGTGLLVIRAGGGSLQGLYYLVTGQFKFEELVPWELYFYLGAVLFSVATWRYWRREPEALR